MPADLDELLARADRAAPKPELPTRKELLDELGAAVDELEADERESVRLHVEAIRMQLEWGLYRPDERPSLRSIPGGRDDAR